MNALIGSHGVIGQTLLDQCAFDHVHNSQDIQALRQGLDQVVIAAPSGQRLKINQGQQPDRENCSQIVQAVVTARPRHVVLISSVDAVTAPHTEYGQNRLWMERQLTEQLPVSVIRLSTLIGSRIRKNILFDIKHREFLDQADGNAWLQWCLLDDLSERIHSAVPGTVQDLVSEPVQNSQILSRYVPDLVFQCRPCSAYYNQQPYVYTREEIFQAMDRYMR